MILVTGATGTVGQRLVPELMAAGARVRALVRNPDRAGAWRGQVELAVGDLEAPETLGPAMRGIEQLYVVTPETKQVANLLAAAKTAGVRHVVKQSTIEANRSLGPGKWHREQESMIERSGLRWTFLRPTLMNTNTIQWWRQSIKAQGAVYFPGGHGHVPAVDPCDVAAVASAVLTQPGHAGQIYELTGPEALTIEQMVQAIGRALGRPLRYISIPGWVGALWMLRFGLPFYVVRGLLATMSALRRDEYAYTTNTVEQLIGRPARRFGAWARDTVAAFG